MPDREDSTNATYTEKRRSGGWARPPQPTAPTHTWRAPGASNRPPPPPPPPPPAATRQRAGSTSSSRTPTPLNTTRQAPPPAYTTTPLRHPTATRERSSSFGPSRRPEPPQPSATYTSSAMSGLEIRALASAGSLALKKNDFHSALKLLGDALDGNPDDELRACLEGDIAFIYLGQRQYADAITACDRALAVAPRSYKIFKTRARACMGLNSMEEAHKNYLSALVYIPKGPAKQALQKEMDGVATALKLKKAEALGKRGNDAFQRKDYRLALRCFHGGIEALSGNADSSIPEYLRLRTTLQSNCAVALLQMGDYRESITMCNMLLRREPNHFKGLRTRGRAKAGLGEWEASGKDLEAALEELPQGHKERPSLWKEIASSYRRIRQMESEENTNDPYKIIGVPRTSTEIEIKKAYRRLALKHHPDKGGSDAAFKRISAAYDILNDPVKRKSFDSKNGRSRGHCPFV